MARNGMTPYRRNLLRRPFTSPFFADFDRFFDEALGGLPQTTDEEKLTWAPAVDIHENDTELMVVADIPGTKKEDLHVEVNDGILTLSGERRMEKSAEGENGEKAHRVERFYGRFTRSFTLPKGLDDTKIEATYRDGVLEVRIPKAEESKPKQIQIK